MDENDTVRTATPQSAASVRGGNGLADPAFAESAPPDYGYDSEKGAGWVAFAGVMIAIVGILNVIYGIAAVSKSKFYTANAVYILSDLNTWGWVILITGAIQFCAALAIFSGAHQWGRWVGIFTAGVNSIIQLIFIPSYPLASLAIFAIDILVIYGLVAYGGRRRATM